VTPAGRVLDVRSPRVAANYFDTFNQRIVAGRGFTEGEASNGREVAIADESFVRLVLGGRSAVGQMVRSSDRDGRPGPWHEIIGVVTDIVSSPSKPVTQTVLYRPLDARPDWLAFLLVRTGTNPAAMAGTLRRAAQGIDPESRLEDVKTLKQVADEEISTYGYLATGYAVVAAVVLLLASAGIYALVSFTLSVRTREIGIRIALGAAPARMIGAVLSRNLKLVGAGAAFGGTLGVLFLAQGVLDTSDLRLSTQTRLLTAFGGVVGIVVLVVAAASCWAPLRRALRIEPTQALRAE
jgi:putative ABC transport system permease protein